MGTSRRRFTTAVTLLAGVLALAGTAAAGGRPLDTPMSGDEVVPAGSPGATGQAHLELNQGQGTICFDISWENVQGQVTSGHIHQGPAGENGGVVVGLFSGTFEGTDAVSGCAEEVPRELSAAIRQEPEAYYVQVHSSVFPAGAIRGQLGK